MPDHMDKGQPLPMTDIAILFGVINALGHKWKSPQPSLVTGFPEIGAQKRTRTSTPCSAGT
jgi:hypothetical protein